MKWLDAVIDLMIYLVVAVGLAMLLLLGTGCKHTLPPGIELNQVGFYEIPLNAPSKIGNYQINGVAYSSSMRPTLEPGDPVAIDTTYPFDNLQFGDLVTVKDEEGQPPYLHRISGKQDGQWITKGDNNIYPDPAPLTPDNYLGKVVAYGRILK